MLKNSFFDLEKTKPKLEGNLKNDELYKIKIKMEKMIKKYFKKEPSILIYFIIDDEKKIEKLDLDSMEKNKIKLEIKSMKKNFSKNTLIQKLLEVIKSNSIETQNLNQILKELNYININEDKVLNKKDQINSSEEKINKINNFSSLSESNENDEESLSLNNSTFSLENIIKINVNKDKNKNQKSVFGDKDEEFESSCNAEYYESTIIPLDEFKDIEMQINSKDKENNNTDNISEENSSSYSKKNLGIDKHFSAMEFLQKKTKKHFSNTFHAKRGDIKYI